jgi:hypothetical protein
MFFAFHKQELIFSTDAVFCLLFKGLSELNELSIYKLVIMQLTKNYSLFRIGLIVGVLLDIADDFDSTRLGVEGTVLGFHADERVTIKVHGDCQ